MTHLHLFDGKRGVQLRNRDAQAQILELHSSFSLQLRPVVPVTRVCEPVKHERHIFLLQCNVIEWFHWHIPFKDERSSL